LPHIQNLYANEIVIVIVIVIETACSGLQLLDAFKLESNTLEGNDCDYE